jgi:arylsulfatase A-like enzyme
VLLDGFAVTVYERVLRIGEHNRWHEGLVDLAAWAGKKVTLSFETYPASTDGSAPWTGRVRAFWGDPRIVAREPLEETRAPHSVILIVVDTLRYDYLGVNGFVGAITPNLDWLAMESIRFDNAIATAPWTKPSVASILTGLYPETHGVGGLHPGAASSLSAQAFTLAEAFRERGYETAGFVGNGLLGPTSGFGQGFDTYLFDRSDEVLVKKARSWLGERRRRPTFLYLHLIGAHGPYRAPEADYRLLRSSPSLGPERRITPADPLRPGHLDATPFASMEESRWLRSWKAKYGAAIHRLDGRLGALLSELRAAGDLDRAFVVFTADHGEEFLEHGSWEHGYEQCVHQLHVPLWIRRPGAEGAGGRITEVVSLTDIMPTLLALNRLAVPPVIQGEDRSSWVAELPRRGTSSVAFSFTTLSRAQLHSLRTKRYHLRWDPTTDSVELFDLSLDPEERENVAQRYPEVVSRLERRLSLHRTRVAAAGSLRGKPVALPREVRDQLRDLGYVR